MNLWVLLYFDNHISIRLVSFVKLRTDSPQYLRVFTSVDSINPADTEGPLYRIVCIYNTLF